jgi:membrane associated rhomboid family serine protease
MALKHRKCGYCGGSMPANNTACPYCHKSLEHYGKLGELVASLLPAERPMTKVTLGLMVAVYGMVGLLAGGTGILAPSVYSLIHLGANFAPYILEGQVWRLVTAIFLHGDLLHLAFNAYALWIIAPLLENSFGKGRFVVMFMVAGIISCLASFGWGFASAELSNLVPVSFLFNGSISRPSVGMSGAITGLLGAGVAAGWKVKNSMGDQVSKTLIRWMVFIIIFGLVMPGIDNAAHIGGFVAGLGLGAVLPLRDRASSVAGFVYTGLAVFLGLVALGSLGAQAISLPAGAPHDSKFYPRSVFGSTLRQADRDDPSFRGALSACGAALTEIETAGGREADKGVLQRAVVNCDEVRYTVPMDPGYWSFSAAANAFAGNEEIACRRARIGKVMLDYGGPTRNETAVRANMEAIERLAGCQ